MGTSKPGIAAQRTIDKIMAAQFPEDLFGVPAAGDVTQWRPTLLKVHHALVRDIHPDHLPEDAKPLVAMPMTRLTGFWRRAEECLKNGTYGKRVPPSAPDPGPGPGPAPITIELKHRKIVVGAPIQTTDFFSFFNVSIQEPAGTSPGVLKVVRDSVDNDLARNEIQTLTTLHKAKGADVFGAYLPTITEAFTINDNGRVKQTALFPPMDGLFTLEQVIERYPAGVDPRAAAWMFNRMLEGLGFAHSQSIVHGMVVPSTVYINPANHGAMLTDWSMAVQPNQHVKAICQAYRDWYAPEVLKKQNATPETDIYMAAKCIIKLLGGDPLTNTLPTGTPEFFGQVLGSCLLARQTARPDDAWKLGDVFKERAGAVWPRKFIPFEMTPACNA